MSTQNVPEWAKDAVAEGWTFHQNDRWPKIERKLARKATFQIYFDGVGGIDSQELMPYFEINPGPVADSLKLANQYAEANGGWA